MADLRYTPGMGSIRFGTCFCQQIFGNSSALLMSLMALQLMHVDRNIFCLVVYLFKQSLYYASNLAQFSTGVRSERLKTFNNSVFCSVGDTNRFKSKSKIKYVK